VPPSLIASASGWSLVVMTAITVAVPFLLHRQLRTAQLRLKLQKGRVFLKRMRPHYWLGYAIAIVTLVHVVVSMGSGLASGVDILGLLLASAAMFLVFAQILLGLNLRHPGVPARHNLRKLHFGMMIAIVALGICHILLDSRTLHTLIR
jgi:magnesium-transporting ATPase (P-type)